MTLTSPTTSGQSGIWSNGKKGVTSHFPQIWNWSLTIECRSDALKSFIQYS